MRRLAAIPARLEQMSKELKAINGLLSIEILDRERRTLDKTDPSALVHFGYSVNSQNAEDGMIQAIFSRIATTSRTFVEIGVGNGCENNTAFLVGLGWKGFWIDGDPSFLQTLATFSKRNSLNTAVAIVTRENVEQILASLSVPQEFDLLSLDVDQNTYHVWDGIHSYKPRVIVIEYNSSLPPDIDWVSKYDPDKLWDGSVSFGASLKALERLGRSKGYSLIGCDSAGVNAFFLRDDLVSGTFSGPFNAQTHYRPPRYSLQLPKGHRPALLDGDQHEAP
jgi:hypothetical protein